MKIEGNRPNLETTSTGAVETKRAAGQKRTGQPAAGSDRVQVSTAAQLAQAAITAAANAPAIRPEVVARAKALLQAGTLGTDATKLADALIDRTIDKK